MKNNPNYPPYSSINFDDLTPVKPALKVNTKQLNIVLSKSKSNNFVSKDQLLVLAAFLIYFLTQHHPNLKWNEDYIVFSKEFFIDQYKEFVKDLVKIHKMPFSERVNTVNNYQYHWNNQLPGNQVLYQEYLLYCDLVTLLTSKNCLNDDNLPLPLTLTAEDVLIAALKLICTKGVSNMTFNSGKGYLGNLPSLGSFVFIFSINEKQELDNLNFPYYPVNFLLYSTFVKSGISVIDDSVGLD